MKKGIKYIFGLLFILLSFIGSYFHRDIYNYILVALEGSYEISDIPDYNGKDYIYINNNIPEFDEELKNKKSFEKYSELDELGRAGVAISNVGYDLMPTSERESISTIKPSGWHTIRYDDLIEDKYLYNRCHLIAFQLTGENANEKNLITCTRQMNLNMVPFENEVADYIKKTKHHVLYRATPIYDGNNLVAKGVQIEALSLEDEKIKFNVFVYNIQNGIIIDYSDGTSKRKI